MRLQINDHLYQSNPEIDGAVYEEFLTVVPQITASIPDNIRVAVKGVIRLVLAFAEMKYPEMKEQLRPEKGVDPLVHCLRIMQDYILQRSDDVTICLTTAPGAGDASINSVSLQFQASGESG